VAFKERPSNVRRDIAVKVLCSENKVSIIGRLLLTLFVGKMRGVLVVDFDKNPSNGRRDIAVRAFSSTSEVPFIIGRLQLTLFLGNMRGVLGVDFDKNPQMEAESLL
jgi:hypothetical protein